TSPNEKERTWAIIMQMLPMVRNFLTPPMALELLDYSPLPASMVAGLKQAAAAQQEQQSQQPNPEQMKAQADQQKFQLEMAGKQADLQAKQASNQMDMQGKSMDLMMKAREAQMDQAVAQRKAEIEMQKLAAKSVSNQIA